MFRLLCVLGASFALTATICYLLMASFPPVMGCCNNCKCGRDILTCSGICSHGVREINEKGASKKYLRGFEEIYTQEYGPDEKYSPAYERLLEHVEHTAHGTGQDICANACENASVGLFLKTRLFLWKIFLAH